MKFVFDFDGFIGYEDFSGNKAIHWACHDNVFGNVEFLVSKGADIYEERRFGGSGYELLNNENTQRFDKIYKKHYTYYYR